MGSVFRAYKGHGDLITLIVEESHSIKRKKYISTLQTKNVASKIYLNAIRFDGEMLNDKLYCQCWKSRCRASSAGRRLLDSSLW